MRIDRSLLNWGVFLIALGGVPLAVQRGWADAGIAGDLWRLWPLILVGIGLGLILRWTPVAWLGGAIVAATFGLIFGALIAGGVQGVSSACVGLGGGEVVTTQKSGPASGGSFDLQLELSCGDLGVARATTAEWTVVAEHGPDDAPTIDGTESGLRIEQGGGDALFALSQQTRSDWQVALPAEAAISMGMTLNAANGSADLGEGPHRTRGRHAQRQRPGPRPERGHDAAAGLPLDDLQCLQRTAVAACGVHHRSPDPQRLDAGGVPARRRGGTLRAGVHPVV